MKQKLSVLLLLLCLTMSIFSQEKMDIVFLNTPILEVLKEAETNYKVKFSFNTIITKNLTFSLKKNNYSLQELISKLEEKTNLRFNKINKRYYFITKDRIISDHNLLNEVQVTNYITSGINKSKNGAITISPQKLGLLPGLTEPDVLETLKIIPGVQSPNETAAGIYIRGGTPGQNLILWDGIKMYYSGHFFGMLSAFNPYTTENITLSKSGTQARYGNKISGVIDIKTNENIPTKTTGGFGFNMTHFDAFITIPLSKKIAVSTSFRRSFTDAFNTFTFNKLSDRVFKTFNDSQERRILNKNVDFERENRFYFADYTSKIIIKPSKKELISLSFLYTKNKLNNSFTIPMYKDNYIDDLDINNKGISFQWKKELSKNLTHKLKTYYSNFQFSYLGKYNYIDGYLIQSSIKENSVKDLGLYYDITYKINHKNKLLFGYDLLSNNTSYKLDYKVDLNGDTIRNIIQEDSGSNNSHSLFTEYIFDNNNWQFNTGLRLNHFSIINKTVIEPRLYLEKKLSNSLDFKTSFELKHQTLSQIIEFQTSSLGFNLENQVWAQVNDDKNPIQKSSQISSGFLFRKNNWKIDIETYYKNVKGITSQTRGFNDQTSDFSHGKGKVFGIDLLINKKIGNYRTWINYSYTKNQFKFLDLENKFFPANHDITNYFSWSHALKLNNFELSLGWIHRTGNPYTDLYEFRIDPKNGAPTIVLNTDNINAKRLPKYNRADVSAIYNFNFSKRWKGKLGISILNIFNKKNILRRTFTAIPTIKNNAVVYEVGQVDQVSLGITPNLVFRVSF